METVILDFTDKTNERLNSLLDSFSNGIQNAGSLLHKVYLKGLKFVDCLGCTEDPFFVSDGVCKCDDDFNSIYPILKKSDLWVFALDISSKSQFKELSMVLNRMEPMFQLNFNGISSEPTKKIVSLLFSKFDNGMEDVYLNVLKEFSALYNYEYLGTVHRNKYNVFELMPESIFESLPFGREFYNLAYELATNGKLNDLLVEKLQSEIVPSDSLLSDIISFLKRV